MFLVQALAKNDQNWKAMFRKGKALGELGYYERASKVLEELKTKNPSGESLNSDSIKLKHNTYNFPSDAANITAELTRLKAIDVAKGKANDKKLKGQLFTVALLNSDPV